MTEETSTGMELGKCNICGLWHSYIEGINKGCFE